MDEPFALDANAVAGELGELLGIEVTLAQHRCATCGNAGPMGGLRAWRGGPGVVLRCSVCSEVVMRWARTPSGVVFDLRGAAMLELPAS